MLQTETYTLDDALEALEERYEALDADLEGIEQGTESYQTTQAKRDRVGYYETGLRWQRDEEDWGDAEIELGALTAGEKAMMHREAPDHAEGEEMRLWFVAASTVDAPYAGEDLAETFQNLAGCHPAFTEWLEAQVNSLGVPRETGNASSTSSTPTETSDEATSTGEPDSTTSSSSDSPTA